MLEENFENLENDENDEDQDQEVVLEFDAVLRKAVPEGRVRRRDVAVSFLQLLGKIIHEDLQIVS